MGDERRGCGGDVIMARRTKGEASGVLQRQVLVPRVSRGRPPNEFGNLHAGNRRSLRRGWGGHRGEVGVVTGVALGGMHARGARGGCGTG